MAMGRLAAHAALLMSLAALSASTADHGTWVETSSSFSHSESLSNQEELNCLAQAIYFEARGESPTGRIAVGRVVLNRVKSDAYPDTICNVVYQNAKLANKCQFSFACDGKPEIASEKAAWKNALDQAEKLVECEVACPEESLFANPLWQSTHFHANYVNPNWASKLALTGQIGSHVFYRDPSVAPYRSEAYELSARLITSVLALFSATSAL